MDGNTQGEDSLITCVDCGAQFSFSARDQAFYQQRGFQAPRRCRSCRDKRKSVQGLPPAGHAGHAGHAEHAGLTGRASAHAPGTASAAAPQHQFKVNCSGCGGETTVPFKPDPTRPVYCRTCYLNRRKTGPA